MRIRHAGKFEEKRQLPMTPMIDVVFQMLIFFIFSLKIVLPEGDFNIRMPAAAATRAAQPSELLPWTLVMKAGPDGELAELQLSGRSFGNSGDAFARLQRYVRDQLEVEGGAAIEQEVEIDCDYDLNYLYVIRAITAVTGYVEGGQRHKLIERIKFTPPESP